MSKPTILTRRVGIDTADLTEGTTERVGTHDVTDNKTIRLPPGSVIGTFFDVWAGSWGSTWSTTWLVALPLAQVDELTDRVSTKPDTVTIGNS